MCHADTAAPLRLAISSTRVVRVWLHFSGTRVRSGVSGAKRVLGMSLLRPFRAEDCFRIAL